MDLLAYTPLNKYVLIMIYLLLLLTLSLLIHRTVILYLLTLMFIILYMFLFYGLLPHYISLLLLPMLPPSAQLLPFSPPHFRFFAPLDPLLSHSLAVLTLLLNTLTPGGIRTHDSLLRRQFLYP